MAALPTLLFAVFGGDFFFDDLRIIDQVDNLSMQSFIDGLRYRPGSLVWNTASFSLTGNNVTALLIVLAAVNALTCYLLYRLVARFTTVNIGLLAGLFWALLPNVSTAKFWITCTPNLFALTLCLAVALVATGANFRGWKVPFGLAVAVSTGLIYEGAIGLSAATAVLVAYKAPRHNRIFLVVALALETASAYFTSTAPSLDARGEVGSGNVARALSAAIDSALAGGLFGEAGLIALAALIAFVTFYFYRDRATSFRMKTPEAKALLMGLLIVVAGAAPFVASGFPIQNEGLNDRANLYLSPGVSLIFAALTVVIKQNKRLATAFVIAISFVFAAGLLSDLVAYLDLVVTSAGQRYPA